jgi:hypothetical protein
LSIRKKFLNNNGFEYQNSSNYKKNEKETETVMTTDILKKIGEYNKHK